MTTITLTRGVPASGKSTWAQQWVLDGPMRARVNRDEIRASLGITTGVGTLAQEANVSTTEKTLVTMWIGLGYDVVVDSTNLRAKYVKEWLRLAESLNSGVHFKDFPISLSAAIARDEHRALYGERAVGEVVLRSIFTKFTRDGKLPAIPVLEDEMIFVSAPYIPNITLPSAYGFDLDGTLAKMVSRGPFDTSRYHTDAVHEHVAEILRSLSALGHNILILTGRDAEFRPECETWLYDNDIPHDALFMRPQGDRRKDYIVKAELFDKYIAPSYNFRIQFDDRNQVVDGLRDKGIPVFQVAPGDF